VPVAVLFDDELFVHFGFIHLMPVEAAPDLMKARAGQVNGLLGAAELGALSMVTGTHTGRVGFRLEQLKSEPRLAQDWEDVVEASFTVPETAEMLLAAFEESTRIDLPAFISYRARFCAVGMDGARQADASGDPLTGTLDRYLLQLWPAPPRPDRVVRQSAEFARYWHSQAQRLAPPPPSPTQAELAAAELAAEQDRQREQQRFQELMEMRAFGGRTPSEALRAVGGRAAMVARVDHELAESIAALPPHRQRQLAVWTARWACRSAGQADVAWVAAALDALDREQPLPPPFDEPAQAFARMFDSPNSTVTTSGTFIAADAVTRPPVLDPRAAALDSLISASNTNAAAAAIEALAGALAGQEDPDRLLSAVRAVLDPVAAPAHPSAPAEDHRTG
jgi:hypothetical protein